MQELTTYCDRCGLLMENTREQIAIQIWRKHYNQYSSGNLTTYDFCPSCLDAFKIFLAEKTE